MFKCLRVVQNEGLRCRVYVEIRKGCEAGAGAHEDGLKAVSALVASDLGVVGVPEKQNPLSHAKNPEEASILMGIWVHRLIFKVRYTRIPAVKFWYLYFLNLKFLICKMGIIIVSISYFCCEDFLGSCM